MGDKSDHSRQIYYLTEKQMERMGIKAHRIKPTSQSGEWYAVVNPVTGAIKWLRKKIKKGK